jgi:hypothetical protein
VTMRVGWSHWGAFALLAGLLSSGYGVFDAFRHPNTGATDNSQLVLLVVGFVGVVIGAEALRSARVGEEHEPSWPGPGAAILAALVGLVFAITVMAVGAGRYVANPGSNAYEYCPPVFERPDYSQLPHAYQQGCEAARRQRTRVLSGALLAGGLLPFGVGLALRRHGRSTSIH